MFIPDFRVNVSKVRCAMPEVDTMLEIVEYSKKSMLLNVMSNILSTSVALFQDTCDD